MRSPQRVNFFYLQVPSLSLAEFACAPQLSPTSMYLTVPRGKNVSIVCRVASDPPSDVQVIRNKNIERIKNAAKLCGFFFAVVLQRAAHRPAPPGGEEVLSRLRHSRRSPSRLTRKERGQGGCRKKRDHPNSGQSYLANLGKQEMRCSYLAKRPPKHS